MKQPLSEGQPPQEDCTPEEMQALAGLFQDRPLPQVRLSHQTQVLDAMTSLLPQPKTRRERLREWYPLALLISQGMVLRHEIWLASALTLFLGLLATLVTLNTPDTLLFSALAPLVAAAGVSAIYNSISQSMLEIEGATRTSNSVLLLARLTLVFGFNLLFGLLGSAVLVFTHSELLLMPLVMSWLAPMTFLCGLAFFLSIATADPLLASGSSLLIWLVHLLLRQAEGLNDFFRLASLPGLSDPASRPLLLLAASLLVGTALWLLELRSQHERKLQ